MSEVKKQVEAALDHIQRVAFSMPAPNAYTPQIVQGVVAAQAALRAALSRPAPDVPGAEEIFRQLAERQEPLGADFEAAIGDRSTLYETDVPGAEEVDLIRKRHEKLGAEGSEWRDTDTAHDAHTDRATLLRLLDAAREDLAEERAARHDMAYAEGYLAGWGSESESTLESVQRMRAEAVAVLKKLTLNDRPQQTEPKP